MFLPQNYVLLCTERTYSISLALSCGVATKFKVFVRAPDSLNNCRKKNIMTPFSTYDIKDSPKQIQNQELLFQFIHAYN